MKRGYIVLIKLIVLLFLAPAGALVVIMVLDWFQILSTYANKH